MDTPYPSAPRARGGVVHHSAPLPESDSTPVSTAMLHHPELSFLARGIGGYITSLPEGAEITIRALASKAREGEIRVAGALRELESQGYLARRRVRLPDGRLVTHTSWHRVPDAPTAERPTPDPDPKPGPKPRRDPKPDPGPDLDPEPDPDPAPVPDPERDREPAPAPAPAPVPAAAPAPAPAPAIAPAPVPPTPSAAVHEPAPAPHRQVGRASVPQPQPQPQPQSSRQPDPHPQPPSPRQPEPHPHPPSAPDDRGAQLLRSLCLVDLRLTLSPQEVHRLAPALAGWFERGLSDEAITGVLTARLPEPLTHPGGLLAHRLRQLLPPPPTPAPPPLPAPSRPPAPTAPPPMPGAPRWGMVIHDVPVFESCDDCDRAIRSSAPGLCRDCAAARARRAA
ncbi:hypothetical protein ACF1BN_15630 [Streptomyces sp. NPDC014861]|uniref:hypothetical protein n=1 Tax=Streptomyces sp. NPDC014861 TaxID=3364923 RepID=UPI0036F4E021